MEEWREIKDFKGYEVSNYGRVRTHNKITYSKRHGQRHWKDRILKIKTCKQNECRVCLWKDGKDYYFLVHRLVAIAFLGEPTDPKMTVNHIDGNRLNNHIENLEWLSIADNIRHGFRTGLYSNSKSCVLIYPSGEKRRFISIADACRCIGRNDSYIHNCLKKNRAITDKKGNIYRFEV